MDAFFSPDLADILTKVAVFLLVQALVYLILTNSSNIFSSSPSRSQSFRTVRSMSVRRLLARFSDVPVGTDEPCYSKSPSREASSEGRVD
ncbi:hypothetical protein COCNU_03G003400 [Cocos nucifera]|uniref:Uncharacterized protein n=1 Tax=Cocos nucifera TaxID=13894 RepID=A0A8K0I2J7_COCNU|nr:hypothetical protein COCNU_03G003400 [Cocos nucifera]